MITEDIHVYIYTQHLMRLSKDTIINLLLEQAMHAFLQL